MALQLKEIDKIEILTLQDNYIDLAAMDNNEIVQRALPIKDMEIKNSLLAEHGFSTLVTLTSNGNSRFILFDFGFSEHGAAFNADLLSVDLSLVETMVLSHGHRDHFGGMLPMIEKIARKGIELVLHPSAFKPSRFLKIRGELKIKFPLFLRQKIEAAGVKIIESKDPRLLQDNTLLFLGEIPKKTDFEKGLPNAFYEDGGEEKWDPIEDDTAIVANVKGRGLVIISGCAHSGIVNTVQYAQALTGIEKIYVVMGGFHLTGVNFEPIIGPTTEALRSLNPQYIVPTHCTGHKATVHIESEMQDQFLLNMSGTKMTFAA